MAVVSARCCGRQHGGGRWRAVGNFLEVRRAEEGSRGRGVGGGSGTGIFRARPCHGRGREVVAGPGGGRGCAWMDPRRYRVYLGGSKVREAGRVVRAQPRCVRGREVVYGRGGDLGYVWPGPRRYRAFVGGGQAREAVGRVAGKGGVNNDIRVGRRVEVEGDKVWGVRVRHRAEVNGGKVWLAWSDQQVFVEGRGDRGSSPCCGRGRAFLDPRRY